MGGRPRLNRVMHGSMRRRCIAPAVPTGLQACIQVWIPITYQEWERDGRDRSSKQRVNQVNIKNKIKYKLNVVIRNTKKYTTSL